MGEAYTYCPLSSLFNIDQACTIYHSGRNGKEALVNNYQHLTVLTHPSRVIRERRKVTILAPRPPHAWGNKTLFVSAQYKQESCSYSYDPIYTKAVSGKT